VNLPEGGPAQEYAKASQEPNNGLLTAAVI